MIHLFIYGWDMGRPRSPDFLDRLLRAGLGVFAERGLKRARIGDIADRMGAAHGTIYNYVESKEALFWLLVDRGLTSEPIEIPEELPVRAPTPERVLERLAEQIVAAFPLPKLDAALARRRVSDAAAELDDVLAELYDRTLATRQLAAAIERSSMDLPEMFQLFFVRVRRGLFAQVQAYIEKRVKSGHFLAVGNAEAAAHYLLETITVFARHRFADPDPMQASEQQIRATTLHLLSRSFIDSKDTP